MYNQGMATLKPVIMQLPMYNLICWYGHQCTLKEIINTMASDSEVWYNYLIKKPITCYKVIATYICTFIAHCTRQDILVFLCIYVLIFITYIPSTVCMLELKTHIATQSSTVLFMYSSYNDFKIETRCMYEHVHTNIRTYT